jgi:CHAT domain-containing protein
MLLCKQQEQGDSIINAVANPGPLPRAVITMIALLSLAQPLLAQDSVELRRQLDAAVGRLADSPAREVLDAHLRPIADAALQSSNGALQIDALVALGGTYRSVGMTTLALDALTQAQTIADGLQDPARVALVLNSLGLTYRAQGKFSQAAETLESGLERAGEASRRDLQAALLNDLALTQVMSGDDVSARDGFEQAETLARDLDLHDLQATACINGTRLAVDRGQLDGAHERLGRCMQAAERLDSPGRRASHATAIGTILAHGQRFHAAPAEWRLGSFEAFENGRQYAVEAGDKRAESFALGYIGGLYEDEDRHEEALAYSREAAFLAQLSGAPEGLYLWQWQIAKALRGLGDTEGAVGAYRQSIATLNRIKSGLVASSSDSFRERVGPVFFELADLLLENVAAVEDPAEVERSLRAVRDTIEQVKVAEVQEYFNNACMIGSGSSETIESVASNAAIIYPILFDDRVELLVSLPSGLKRYRSNVGLNELTREVRQFRRKIERYDGQDSYLDHGQRLYSWLIEPAIGDLESDTVDTLVMVPDGPLRTIPMSALYDGDRFMIERFAFATTPGLMLTDPQPLQRDNVETLAVGLTEAVQGFSALPNVEAELANITKLFPATTYIDEEFRGEQVENEIARGDYSIVHVATHGQFDSDHTRSFLLTYDEKLTMDELRETIGARQFSDEPVELLVLSACETAAGDDRAALGLAGVALQAGARTAVATLWFINDESTAGMVSEFYRQLDSTELSKAQALRAAQLFLLQQPRYRHPSYWAPFLLIGNWL